MILILAEKHSAAENFKKALGGEEGGFEGVEYRITHASGHLYGFPRDVESLVPDDKKEKYAKWDIRYLPWDPNDFKWRISPLPGAKKTIDQIKRDLSGISEVCIATDNDASGEGDLLAWEILLALRWKGKVTRMLFDDETPKSVQKAFRVRMPIESCEKYGPFVKARARTKFDYLSMQFTRYASLMAKAKGRRMLIRQGRLKSVMVYLVGKQLDLVKNYKKVPFYEARYRDENGIEYKRAESDEIRKGDPSEIDLSALDDANVVQDSKERRGRKPGKLLDLAGLSSILAARGHDPKEILRTYQKMYEDHIVSYPRTDDKKITQEQYNELRDNRFAIAKVVNVDPALLTHDKPWGDKHVADKATHGANRPGSRIPESLDSLLKYGPSGPAIYEILAKNSLAIFGEAYIYDYYTGHIETHPEFVGHASVPIDLGFKQIFDVAASKDDEEEENDKTGSPLGTRASSYIYEGANPKPKNPTMKWLIGPGGQLEKYNVGTGATRTSTFGDISDPKNPNAQLIKMSKKGVLSMTEIGDTSYLLLQGCKIASPEVTEELFNAMDEVGNFTRDPDTILHSITPIMEHDMAVMRENAEKIPKGPDLESVPKDKVTAVYAPTGETVSFNRKWGTHEFTDEEVERLLSGEQIAFTYIGKGKSFLLKGALAKQKYKGKTFWGFQREEEDVPDSWGKHVFSDKEKELLRKGKKIHVEMLWSEAKKKWYKADLMFERGKIKPSFGNQKGKS